MDWENEFTETGQAKIFCGSDNSDDSGDDDDNENDDNCTGEVAANDTVSIPAGVQHFVIGSLSSIGSSTSPPGGQRTWQKYSGGGDFIDSEYVHNFGFGYINNFEYEYDLNSEFKARYHRRACKRANGAGGISDWRSSTEYLPALTTYQKSRAWGSLELSTRFCIFPGITAQADMSMRPLADRSCIGHSVRHLTAVLAQERFGP